MKNKKLFILVILLTLLIPYTMVLAEEEKKDIASEESEAILTIGAMNEDEEKKEVPEATVGTENNMSGVNESAPITTTGDNPASVDNDQMIIPMVVGTAVLVAIVLTIVIVTKNKKSEKKEGE